MKMTDEIRIEAPRDKVYAALNDTETLKKAIPGCQDLERISETELTATVQAKVGPVKAKFKGNVTLSDLNPPESYTISGEGKGGVAGFAKGQAKVTLTEDGNATVLRYEVDADVGGKLAQVGSRLIEGTSKKLAGEFFETFSVLVSGTESEEAPAEAPSDGLPVGWIIGALVISLIGIFIYFL
ncbi:MAG: carbon monoxide dehydrogenase subunit G [Rhodospirillales bacterium]|nr:carbon monoxide dehydrogenase subunit G [Rhodospirillales bacterium]